MNASVTFSNSSRSSDDTQSLFNILVRVRETSDYVTVAFGILPNLWILLSILTSQDLRARMRNKIICSSCVLHLLNCLLLMPMYIEAVRLYQLYNILNCNLFNVIGFISLLQDFISNWTLVLLVIVFIARLCDFKPYAGLSNLTTTLGTYAILLSPWVASLVIIPGIRNSFWYSYVKSNNISYSDGCIFSTSDALLVIKSLDTVVPLMTAVALMVTAVVLRHRRFTRGFSGDMEVELIERGPEVDDHFGYTAAVAVSFVCDFATAFMFFDLVETSMTQRWIFYVTAYVMSQAKVVLIALPWLLFPDIRERIKTWRPWHCVKTLALT